jgi:hypothetical protein
VLKPFVFAEKPVEPIFSGHYQNMWGVLSCETLYKLLAFFLFSYISSSPSTSAKSFIELELVLVGHFIWIVEL